MFILSSELEKGFYLNVLNTICGQFCYLKRKICDTACIPGVDYMSDSRAIILSYSQDPERICYAAAKISNTLGSATEIYHGNIKNQDQLISNVLKLGHKSIIEHANFTIAFENVSAFVEQYMIEFRLGSFTVKSRRYVDFSKMGYYVPDFRVKEFSNISKIAIKDIYCQHMNFLFKEYKFFIENGIPKEDARFILPYSYKSNFYFTLNARELLHVLYSAIYGRGSRYIEINNIGLSLLKQAEELCPSIFKHIKYIEAGREDKEERLNELLEQYQLNDKEHSKSLCELISYTPDPERVIVISALIKNKLISIKQAYELLNENDHLNNKIIDILITDKRKREFEQINFTFKINNLSLAGLTHLVRHRMQSINIPSFIEFGKSKEHIVPDTITNREDLFERYCQVWNRNDFIFEHLSSKGVVPEDLVYLYLSGNLLDLITTMNGRQLIHFLQLRLCNRAQWEIRNIAIEMLKALRLVAPNIFSKIGPSCFMTGSCPEKKLTCGKMHEVRLFFKEI